MIRKYLFSNYAIIRAFAWLMVGFLISFTMIYASAVTISSGSTYSFWLGLSKYANYATIYYDGTEMWARTTLDSYSGECDPGYLGVSSKIYRETSSGAGTYYLVYSSDWIYNSSEASGLSAHTNAVGDLTSGDYMVQGRTAVYYDGEYQYKNTHITPFIQVS